MAKIGDKVKYVHGKGHNRFHEGVDVHDAIVTNVVKGKTINLSILAMTVNENGDNEERATIPISGVMHKSDKNRPEDSAYWE